MPTTKEVLIAEVQQLPEGLSVEQALVELCERALAHARLDEAANTPQRFSSDDLRKDVKQWLSK